MNSEFIERREGGYYVAGTRISLDSVVYAFNRGESAVEILDDYPLLGKLTRVEGAIAFYLDHKPDVDKYLDERAREFEANRMPLADENPALWARLSRARAQAGDK